MTQEDQQGRLAVIGPCPRILIERRYEPIKDLVEDYTQFVSALGAASRSFRLALQTGAYTSAGSKEDAAGFYRVFFILGPQHTEDPLRFWFQPVVAPGSPFLLEVLREQLPRQSEATLDQLLIDMSPPRFPLFRIIYEARLLKRIRKGSLRATLMFEDGSEDRLPTALDAFAPPLHVTGQMSSINPELTTFQPVSAGFPTFDGIVATPKRLYLLQVAMRGRQAVSTVGFQRVIELAQQSGHRGDFVLVYLVPAEEHASSLVQGGTSKVLLAHAWHNQVILRVGAIVVGMQQYADVSSFQRWSRCN
jgi:hypothetical protein